MIFENKKVLFAFLGTFISLFLLLAYLFSGGYFLADDPSECFMKSYNIKELFLNPYNHNLFSGFFCKLFGFYLPKLTNLHPTDFKAFYFNYIESALLLGILFTICRLYYQKKKIDYAFILYFFTSLVLFFLCLQLNNMLVWVYPGLFRMLFPTFFFVMLILTLTNITKNKEVERKDKIIVPTLTLLCCTTNEMISIVTLLTLIFIFINSLSNQKFFIEKKLQINSLVVAFIGLVCYSFAFFRKIEDGTTINYDYIVNLFSLFGSFIAGYFKLIILNQLLPISLLLILSTYLVKKGELREENINIVKILSFSLISFLIFFLLLFFLGKTHYNGGFWVEHVELLILFNIVLITNIFIIFRQILQQGLLQKKHFIIFCLLTVLVLGFCNFKFYSGVFKEIKSQKVEAYKIEKILRVASLQQRVALLPDSVLKIGYLWCFFAADWKNLNRFKTEIHYNSDFISFYRSFEEESSMFENGYLYVPKMEAYEDFQKYNGGFAARELKNPKFTKLLDKNFLTKDFQ